MTEIILVRHGEVDGNIRKKFIGFTDHSLNENGNIQVKDLSIRLNQNFDIAYISSLTRTRETFEILKKSVGVSKEVFCDDIKERNFGIFENSTAEEIQKKHSKEYSMLCSDWENYKIPDGESAKETYLRVCNAFDEIVKNNIGKRILLVTHLGCIRFILANKIVGKMSNFWSFNVSNATYTKIEVYDGFYVLDKLNC